jgi:hypothetical protein
VIQSLSSRSQHPLAFASYSPFTGSLSNPADGGFFTIHLLRLLWFSEESEIRD